MGNKRKKTKKVIVVEKKLGRQKAWGLCYQGENLIEIDSRLKPKHFFFTLIHECLHHVCPNMSESMVTRCAPKIGKILWEQKFRRISE